MPLKRRKNSPYWQIEFEIAGREIRRSSRTTDRAAAEELEETLRRNLWRQIKLGEKHFTWDDAIEQCKLEDSGQTSWERTERALASVEGMLTGTPLKEINRPSLLKIREVLSRRQNHQGHPWAKSTVNRVMAVIRSVLKRAADPDGWNMLDSCPKVPMYRLAKVEPRWITREQAHKLLGKFPPHTRGMMIFALATGLRRSNVTGMEWTRVDMKRCTAYVPGDKAKGKEAITVPLNSDAMAILREWEGKHERYVFCFRGRAPIKQVATRMWRRVVKECGLEGVTFHTMRHSWASWQMQAETPLKMLQELGGWATLEMPLRYAHLAPGYLSQYAERSALGPAPEEKKSVPVSVGTEDDSSEKTREKTTKAKRRA